ncbi:MAG TPA: TetR/AcrR family transcriptional regulator [Longimicrobiales bacterium]|nr:TetR/AcrR family transcriptional regulator [Longimicrobiales bacterium]
MTDLLPLHPPRQLRSRRTLERIVRASLQILDEGGLDGLTVQAIVERAGSSVGSFYARFAGKDELLAYLGERMWREAAARWDEAVASREMEGLGLEEVVEGAVRLLAEAVTARATYLRDLRRSSGAGDGAFGAFQAHVLGGIEGLLLARAGEMSHPDPQVGVRLGLQAILAVLEEGGGEGRADPIPRERRAQEAVRILGGYLTDGSRGGSAGGQVDFFDIWG